MRLPKIIRASLLRARIHFTPFLENFKILKCSEITLVKCIIKVCEEIAMHCKTNWINNVYVIESYGQLRNNEIKSLNKLENYITIKY